MVTDLSFGHEAHASADWLKLLQEHRVQYVVLSVGRDGGLLTLLRSNGGWEARWEVGGTVLLARATSQPQKDAGAWTGDHR